MTYVEFLANTTFDKKPNPNLRYGQWLVNYLHEVRPDLRSRLQNTSADPFYVDSNLPAFWAFLMENW